MPIGRVRAVWVDNRGTVAKSRPRAPAGLGSDGRRLWRAVWERFVLDPHEAAVLHSACVIADVIGRLTSELAGSPSVLADPAVPRELRPQSLALGRLLSALRLPTEQADVGRPQRRGTRGVLRGGR